MKVLVACEYSGIVRDAFIRKGHDAISCDLLPTESPGPHHMGDVRPLLKKHWDLVIAHPVCTYITNSGCRWLDRDIERWKKMWEGCQFFNEFLDLDCEKVCIENPIPHKYALGWLRRGYTQIVHPWQFGHTEKKSTCLWLKGLPPLIHTNNVKSLMIGMSKKETDKVHYASPGPDRAKIRSATFSGIADAFAEQWGSEAQKRLF